MARAPKKKTRKDGTIADRNANGEGSVYFVASANRWRATYKDPTSGKRRTVVGSSRAEAIAKRDGKLDELMAKVCAECGCHK